MGYFLVNVANDELWSPNQSLTLRNPRAENAKDGGENHR